MTAQTDAAKEDMVTNLTTLEVEMKEGVIGESRIVERAKMIRKGAGVRKAPIAVGNEAYLNSWDL